MERVLQVVTRVGLRCVHGPGVRGRWAPADPCGTGSGGTATSREDVKAARLVSHRGDGFSGQQLRQPPLMTGYLAAECVPEDGKGS